MRGSRSASAPSRPASTNIRPSRSSRVSWWPPWPAWRRARLRRRPDPGPAAREVNRIAPRFVAWNRGVVLGPDRIPFVRIPEILGTTAHVWGRPPSAMTGRVRTWSIALGLILAGVLGYSYWRRAPPAPSYVMAEVTRGPVVRTITTTGAVDPVITVQVGAYVSGTIQASYCDYNTKVKPGQLCAKIDPRPYQVVVDQDAANLANAQAQLKKDQASLAYAKISYARDQALLGRGIVSRDTVDNDKSTYDQAVAQVKVDESTIQQRQAELHAAQVNLDYTNIISPVEGTVVARNITIGQTVAASFQTPTLFLIAQDLTKMQVDTNVSETDVGNAKVGQK